MKLEELLYDLFNSYEDYEDIINALRNLESEKEITGKEYNIILKNYDKWLKKYEENYIDK